MHARRLRTIHTSARFLEASAPRTKKPVPRYNFNTQLEWGHEAADPGEEARYRRVTAREIKGRREEGRRVRMLVRDWVDDGLYNVSLRATRSASEARATRIPSSDRRERGYQRRPQALPERSEHQRAASEDIPSAP